MFKRFKLKKIIGFAALAALALSLSLGESAQAQEQGRAESYQSPRELSGEVFGTGEMALSVAIETALINNPGLMEIGQRAEAAAAVPSQAGSLPDPML